MLHQSRKYVSGPTWNAIEWDALHLSGQDPTGMYGIFANVAAGDYVILPVDSNANNHNRPNVHYTAPSILFPTEEDAEAFVRAHNGKIWGKT